MTGDIKVPAVIKTDKIFMYLYYNGPATQGKIARELNISKASTCRLLSVLTQMKYLDQENKEYKLGEKIYFLSTKYEKYNLIKNIAYPCLEELSLKFKETFKISVLDGDKVRSIVSVESSDVNKISVGENAIFPLHAGAASKLLICQLPNETLDKLLGNTLAKYTENTITDREKLNKELMKINIHKLSFDDEEHSKGIKAVAVPILNKKNIIIAAVSCPCYSEQFTDEKKSGLIRDMERACAEIEKRLAYFDN